MARSVNTRSTARKTPIVPVTLDLFRAVVADAVRDALPSAPSNDPLHGEPEEGTTVASARTLHDVQTEAPQAFTNRDVDLTDPAQKFFSDVTKPRHRTSKAVVGVTRSVAPLEPEKRVEAARDALVKARQVLSYVNPELKGKSRKWGVNSIARKRANETALQLVSAALKSLTAE